MDSRERETWRRWVTEQTPEAAVAWAKAHGRAMQRDAPETFLKEASELVDPRLRAALEAAAKLYVDRPLEEVLLVDMDWLTECHFWLVDGVGPATLRQVASFYETRGMKLETGSEDQAAQDAAQARARVKAASHVEWKVDCLQADKKRLKAKIAELEQTIRDLAAGKVANKLRAELSEAREDAVSIDILRKENERLVKLIQERGVGHER
jgi:hypothetical protein